MEPSSGHPSFDQALKRLLQRAHAGFLALVAPGLTWQGALSPELPAVARLADLVWRVAWPDGRRGLLHIELQTRPDAAIGERLAEYALLLWRREHLPVRSLVVYLRPANDLSGSPFTTTWLDGRECLRYAFDEVRLWEVPLDRVLATPYPELWALAGLLDGATVETTAAVAERLAEVPVSREERTELLGTLTLLAGLRLPREALFEALRRRAMLDELWKESSVGVYLEEEGAARGRAEGEAEGMRRAARIALEARFGPLDEAMTAAVASADTDVLTDIVASLFSEPLPAIRARLGLR